MTYHDVAIYETDDGTTYAVEADDQSGQIRLSRPGSVWHLTQADAFRLGTMLMQGVGAAPVIVQATRQRDEKILQANQHCTERITQAVQNAGGHTLALLHTQGTRPVEDFHGKAHGGPFNTPGVTEVSGEGGPW